MIYYNQAKQCFIGAAQKILLRVLSKQFIKVFAFIFFNMNIMRLLTILTLLVVALSSARGFKNPNYWSNRSVMVHLFEWRWGDIANECERFLGPKGYGGVQISPPNENLIVRSHNRPWWERYQTVSYTLNTRSGNEQALADMIRRCNAVGVRIYADAIINHMSGPLPDQVGTNGNTVHHGNWHFPGVPYGRNDFNFPHCVITGADYVHNAVRVRNCELVGLRDLNQGTEYVRQQIVGYMNRLINLGVAGFRIDAAKHMWPGDLNIIYNRLNRLNTAHGFAPNSRPYIYQEVIDLGGEAVSAREYTSIAAVTEFKFGQRLSNVFLGRDQLRWLVNWGTPWGFLNSGDALVFIDNHDNQRGHGAAVDILSHTRSRLYRAATAFMLAHPFGEPQIMSSFRFTDTESSPPQDSNQNIIGASINADGTCGNGWVCEHRWRQMFEMVGFRNAVRGTGLNDWWDNGNNQIAFCRGGRGFIVFNNDNHAINRNFQTCLPPGRYCDVISGSRSGNSCRGRTVTVGNAGIGHINLGNNEGDLMIAIHAGPESRL